MVTLPSLDWALFRLTGVWVQDSELIRCPLPGHDDSTPSFNLWAHDESGVPQRFGCFGCGRGGDVLDLIEILEGISDTEALRRADELAAEEARDTNARPRRRPEPDQPPREFEPLLRRLYEEFDASRLELFQRYMSAKGLGGEDIETYAMEEWGWTATNHGAVVVPHRGPKPSMEITGLKYRTLDRKWNEEGSRFPYLYGSWRDRGRPRVVLCEGETDTVWAAWSLRHEDDIDVLGLPSGANQSLRPEWLEQIGDRELTIVFDSDRAGMTAARQWVAARPGALLARLPEGEDLLSCGLPVKEVLRHARSPRQPSGLVTIADGVISKVTSNGTVPIADFALQPIRELRTEEGPAWDVWLSGTRDQVLIRASDLHSGSRITRWANQHGVAWTGGNGPAVQGLFNWLMTQSSYLPLELATSKAGKIGRSYVGPGFCIGPDRMRYIPPVYGDAKLETKLRITAGSWDPRAIVALERLNDPKVMAIILGWVCATLLRGQRPPAPPLFVSGESGAGKTSMLAAVLESLGFYTELNLTTTTPYGVDCLVNSTVGFPVWFDEYRGGAREDSMSRLRQLLRDAYYGQPSMKGGMTQQATEITEISTWAGIVVSGEMSSQETSHRDRIVMIDLERSAQNREALAFLQDRRRTEGMGHALLTFLSARPDSLFQVQPLGSPDLPSRFRDTLGFVQAGWEAWRHFRWEQGLRDDPGQPDLSLLAAARSQADDPWLEAIKACEGVSTRDGHMIVSQDAEGTVLIPAEVVVEARRVGIELPARANELVAWLRRHYEAVEDVRVHGRRAKRVRGMRL
jgi:hypothetical protein